MAASIDMFGTGGEALGGFFLGQQLAQQRDAAAADQMKTLADVANMQETTRAAALKNRFAEETYDDNLSLYRHDVQAKKDLGEYEKFQRFGQSVGQLKAMMEGIPPAARPAALKQMTGQIGVAEDNPMLQALMSTDPNELPNVLGKWADEAYKASDKYREQAQEDDASMARTKYDADMRAQIADREIAARREMNREDNSTRLKAANIAAAPGIERARAKSQQDDYLKNMSTDQAISFLERKKAVQGLEPAEDLALYRLKEFKYNQGTLRTPDTASQIFQGGTPSAPQQRVQEALGPAPVVPGATPPPPPVKPTQSIEEVVKKSGQKYEPDKYEYRVTPDGRVQRKPK